MIHQHDRQHRFSNRHRADTHARIVTAFGDHFNFFARAINRVTRHRDAGSRLQCDIGHNLLAAADTAQNTARMIALETLRGDFVAILAAA
ncbi:hypothetical protein D3C72_2198840 [compost metagenome]